QYIFTELKKFSPNNSIETQTRRKKRKLPKANKGNKNKKHKKEDFIDVNDLDWSEVVCPESVFLGGDEDLGGFLCLEEIDNVDVEYEETATKGSTIRFKKVASNKPNTKKKNPPAKPHEPLSIEELSKYHDLDTFNEQSFLKGQQSYYDVAPVSHSDENLVSKQDEDGSNLQLGNEKFNLSLTIMNGLKALKFERPTPIQEKTLHASLNGRDVIGKAETGSGKTLAFGIPILEYIIKRKKKDSENQLVALILTPTRELAMQIRVHLQNVGKTLVFVNSIDAIRRLIPMMRLLNIEVFALHAQMQQRQRLKNLDRDVAARGLDIPLVDHVMHYQLPRSGDVPLKKKITLLNLETLAMKGLFLNHMDKKEDAREFVRKGLRSDLKILKIYEGTLKPGQTNYEHSEMLLYHNLIIDESGKTEEALEHLDSIKNNVCDRRTWKEKRELINDNPDCYGYYEGLQIAKGINTNDLTPECEEKIIDLYKDLSQKYPKSNAIKLFPLLYTTGDNFKMFVDEYIQAALRKGVPSLFVNLKKLYSDPQKEVVIEQLVEGYRECLKNNSTFTQPKNDDYVKEPPTAYLWTLYLLSQHYDNKRDTTKALMLIDEAIEHTPTLVELYMTKGRILKHGGDLNEAMKVMNEARELDLQDRFINSKCSKYMLRNDQAEEAEQKIGLFTRGDAPDPLTDLADMQCMWFVLEEGESYIRQKKWGKALKRFHQIEKIYIELYDNPNTVTVSEENEDYAKEDVKKKVDKPQDDDPDGEKLLKTEDPLGEAFKFLLPLQELSPKRIETHLLGFEIYLRKKKYLLALRALLRAYNIDKENAALHNDIIRFHLAVSDDKEINPTVNQVIASEKVTLIPENMPLVEFNERFLERNKGIPHLLVGAKTLYAIDPEKRQEAENLLLMVDSEEYASTRTLE
ncbi:5817_t:CDS:10, partial [Racocetra fulgida]